MMDYLSSSPIIMGNFTKPLLVAMDIQEMMLQKI